MAREIARRRLAAPEGAVDEDLSLAWLELVILAQRDPGLRRAIAPIRAEMLERLDGARTDDIPLTTPALAALLTGLELARAICPEPTSVRELIAANMSTDEICKFIGADSLTFLSVPELVEALGGERKYSLVSFDGDYFIKD